MCGGREPCLFEEGSERSPGTMPVGWVCGRVEVDVTPKRGDRAAQRLGAADGCELLERRVDLAMLAFERAPESAGQAAVHTMHPGATAFAPFRRRGLVSRHS